MWPHTYISTCRSIYVCINSYIHVCMHTYILSYILMHVCLHIYIYAYKQTCIPYACLDTYTRLSTNKHNLEFSISRISGFSSFQSFHISGYPDILYFQKYGNSGNTDIHTYGNFRNLKIPEVSNNKSTECVKLCILFLIFHVSHSFVEFIVF